jgi:NAD+ synthase
MARELGVLAEIVEAISTDGLWGDNRSDEDQIGATYEELEWALFFYDSDCVDLDGLSKRQVEILDIYLERHHQNRHKLELPPMYVLSDHKEI